MISISVWQMLNEMLQLKCLQFFNAVARLSKVLTVAAAAGVDHHYIFIVSYNLCVTSAVGVGVAAGAPKLKAPAAGAAVAAAAEPKEKVDGADAVAPNDGAAPAAGAPKEKLILCCFTLFYSFILKNCI
jgi:hypothetical protein